MGAVQGMVGQLGEKTGGDPQAEGAMNMLTTMMGGLGGGGGDGAPPDLAGMMSGVMGLMSGGGSLPGAPVPGFQKSEKIIKDID